jgi:putative SOS response-associated peptidase YedK
MCNLYNLKVQRWEVGAYGQADDDWRNELVVEKDYTAQGKPGYVLRRDDGENILSTMTWGFPPPPGVRDVVVNVRNYRKPYWLSTLADPEQRCLVPATEFQEWSAEPDPITGKKKPHWFSVPSRKIFCFAGIWTPTDTGRAFAFLTCGYDGDDPGHHVVGRVHPKACPGNSTSGGRGSVAER